MSRKAKTGFFDVYQLMRSDSKGALVCLQDSAKVSIGGIFSNLRATGHALKQGDETAESGYWDRMIYRIRPNVQGYVNMEKFLPGDFYLPQHNGYWFRSEINYRFNSFLPIRKL